MPEDATQRTILIVDDDADTADFFAELLEQAGYTTRHAASGHATLAALDQQSVQLVLLDHRLPDLKGIEVARRIRATRDATVPILLVTADPIKALTEAAREAGITALVQKPMGVQTLLEQVAVLLAAVPHDSDAP